mmetsp:Transcript_21809/g.74986  ORF Transcript_21809/g.74986 Transcript_21809/m.74986 type:complete len:523 (-) Transcript_21809:218-1786(-)
MTNSPIKKVCGLCGCFCCLSTIVLLLVSLIVIFASIQTLAPEQQEVVEYLDGKAVVNGPTSKLFNPFRVRTRREALRIGELQYARIKNTLDMSVRMVEGTRKEFMGPYEESEGVTDKIVLKKDEYIRLVDMLTGVERIERGAKSLIPGAYEEYPAGVEQAIFIDRDQAPVVLNKADGSKRLHTTSGIFFPAPYEHIVELRELIRLLPHEIMVVRNSAGRYVIKSGRGADGTGAGIAFFLGPFDTVVEMEVSRFSEPLEGQNQVVSKEMVSRFDMRVRKTFFQYDVRTSDNVALRVEGAIFWRITDVAKILSMTEDPVGDVAYKCRNALISAVGQVDLETFMGTFEGLIARAFSAQAADSFYPERGVEVQSLEVTKYACSDDETARTLNALIEETVFRLNQVMAQRSQNDVSAARLMSDIWLATQKTDLIQTRATNERLVAAQQGADEGIQLAKSLTTFFDRLNTSLPDLDSRTDVYRLHKKVENHNERTKAIGSGKATLFLQPSDLNINLAETYKQMSKQDL